MNWLNEPQDWTQDGDTLTVNVTGETDFWRIPGTLADNGHFCYRAVTGDFTATVQFRGDYGTLYDQAGLMVRESETVWLKAGVELVDGGQLASSVLTRGFSDWAFFPLAGQPPTVWFQVQRKGAMVEVRYALDGADYQLTRQGYLTDAPTLQVGMMCAAPKGTGFRVTFAGFTVQA